MKAIPRILFLSALVFACFGPVSAEIEDFSGDWRFIIENSHTRKQITMRIQEENNRLRGKWASKEFGSHDLDGRREGEDRFLLWSVYQSREGATTESSFKGRIEGETLVGDCEVFRKRYKFTAERITKD